MHDARKTLQTTLLLISLISQQKIKIAAIKTETVGTQHDRLGTLQEIIILSVLHLLSENAWFINKRKIKC